MVQIRDIIDFYRNYEYFDGYDNKRENYFLNKKLAGRDSIATISKLYFSERYPIGIDYLFIVYEKIKVEKYLVKS